MADTELVFEWVHVSYAETSAFVETYGFSGNQNRVNLEGVRMRRQGSTCKTLAIFMHPAATLQLLPVPRSLAEDGIDVLCGGSRYAKNDTALIMEKVLLDLGAYIRHAKEVWGYEKIILAGWSGGGSLALFYQSQAENPTIVDTPAGDAVSVKDAGLIPADGVMFQAGHLARALTFSEWIDPSITDELNPNDRIMELDLYDPRNPNKPPYDADYIAHFRKAQLARIDRIRTWVLEQLETLKRQGGKELERSFVVHRTMADPRFLDPTLEPNDRRPRWCYLGEPETVNTGPVGVGRYSTLRSWLSQWSPQDSRANGLKCAPLISVPLLCIENSADDAVPPSHAGQIFRAGGSADKVMHVIKGANHYYQGQPELLAEANAITGAWLRERKLLA